MCYWEENIRKQFEIASLLMVFLTIPVKWITLVRVQRTALRKRVTNVYQLFDVSIDLIVRWTKIKFSSVCFSNSKCTNLFLLTKKKEYIKTSENLYIDKQIQKKIFFFNLDSMDFWSKINSPWLLILIISESGVSDGLPYSAVQWVLYAFSCLMSFVEPLSFQT